jgi:hypothetical protein
MPPAERESDRGKGREGDGVTDKREREKREGFLTSRSGERAFCSVERPCRSCYNNALRGLRRCVYDCDRGGERIAQSPSVSRSV